MNLQLCEGGVEDEELLLVESHPAAHLSRNLKKVEEKRLLEKSWKVVLMPTYHKIVMMLMIFVTTKMSIFPLIMPFSGKLYFLLKII